MYVMALINKTELSQLPEQQVLLLAKQHCERFSTSRLNTGTIEDKSVYTGQCEIMNILQQRYSHMTEIAERLEYAFTMYFEASLLTSCKGTVRVYLGGLFKKNYFTVLYSLSVGQNSNILIIWWQNVTYWNAENYALED